MDAVQLGWDACSLAITQVVAYEGTIVDRRKPICSARREENNKELFVRVWIGNGELHVL